MEQYFNFDIKDNTTFGISALTKEWVSFDKIEDLQQFITKRPLSKEKHFIIGGGSNLLFVNNFKGLIVKANFQGIELLEESEKYIYLKAGAGVVWDDFVEYCVQNNYWGAENLSIIPGTVGASPVQNIGAYGVEAQDIIYDVRAINKETGKERIFSFADCQFAYRDSFFKQNQEWIVSEVVYRLTKAANRNLSYGPLKQIFQDNTEPSIQEIRDAVIRIRESKLPDPKEIGNAGSFFKNPIVSIEINNQLMQDYPQIPYYLVDIDKSKLAAGWLIDQAGWRGHEEGNVGVHEKQALVLINKGGATGKEIYDLSQKIVDSVKKEFKVELEREVIVV